MSDNPNHNKRRHLRRRLAAAVARAEAAEAERDEANALGAETTVQLKSAQYHLGVMVKAWEAAEARIAAALAIPEPEFSDRPFANENGANDSVRGQRSMRDRFRAALAEPVEPQRDEGWKLLTELTTEQVSATVGEPQPSACATCGGEKWVDDPTWALADELPPYVPCPSCTPPDPAPHRGAEIDCCEDDPDAWFAVCPECGWQSPQGRSRHEVATALAHHQANRVAPPDPESETP